MGEWSGEQRKKVGCWRGLVLLLLLVCILLGASAVLISRRQAAINESGIRLLDADARLGFVRRLMLQSYLAERAQALAAPAGAAGHVAITIPAGATADQVAADLVAAGVVSDPELFINYLRYYGQDARLQAGQFTLSGQMSIPQLAEAIVGGSARDVIVSFLPGMRLEEMADVLRQTTPARIDADEFLAIARRRQRFDLAAFSFLNSLGVDMTLEGFLLPGTYSVPFDADAAYLVTEMLHNFDRQVTPAMRQAYGTLGLSLPEAVIVASIVARETPFDEERQRIASVYINRVRQGMLLQADPTVQYALGYQPASGTWWKAPLSLADLRAQHPYNTYVSEGLPPGPIANPGLASLQAVADPEETDFLFFVVDCASDPPGRHIFSRTYEEHLAHVQRCR